MFNIMLKNNISGCSSHEIDTIISLRSLHVSILIF